MTIQGKFKIQDKTLLVNNLELNTVATQEKHSYKFIAVAVEFLSNEMCFANKFALHVA